MLYLNPKTFKGLTNLSDNLDRKVRFKLFDGDKLVAKVPLSWKKNFYFWRCYSSKINKLK